MRKKTVYRSVLSKPVHWGGVTAWLQDTSTYIEKVGKKLIEEEKAETFEAAVESRLRM